MKIEDKIILWSLRIICVCLALIVLVECLKYLYRLFFFTF